MHPDAQAGPCPACLLAIAAEPVSDLSEAMTTLSPPSASRTASEAGPGAHARLAPGQDFGPYRIVRLLGRGGMGEVYEAEQREQGRRVALKVLSQRLTNPHDRARFLREGQLAASINHPHSVYIFGSEEIAGTPVIAMEHLAGGTLKDRVREQGPLPPAEAVDAILQIISGLGAAQAGGILHRDIKPANCFTDRDGTVKIGDFGLSISTMPRDVTQLTRTGTFQGTPKFAAPEQLKGEPLDVRSDIYAVGATVYYLLTGQPPFGDTDLVALLTRIATEAPRSPRELQPRVPRGLATIVLRCLAKDRASRPATYAALDEALRPFASTAPTPATLGLRFVAGAIDRIIWMPLSGALTGWILTVPLGTADFALRRWLAAAVPIAIMIAYYGILEGLWGASIGKWMIGLRVTKADGQPAGMASALWRAAVFQTPTVVAALPAFVLGQERILEQSVWLALVPVWGIGVLLLFPTARRRNGFAGVHDLASRTRVVRRIERDTRSVMDAAHSLARTDTTSAQWYGPYEVVRTLGSTDVGELLVGFDANLRRHVWIHTLPKGVAAVSPLIRDLSRPARLRWLSGRRSTSEAWDAYEALDGMPLVTLLDAQPWSTARLWLLDLAREIDAGLKDESITALTMENVWITRDGHAKLLDFRAPGVPPIGNHEGAATLESGQTLLASIARCALDGPPGDETGATAVVARDPVPLSASETIATLARRGFTTSSEMVARTAALVEGPERLGRWHRCVPLALCGFPPAIAVLTIVIFTPSASRPLTQKDWDMIALNDALIRLSSISQDTDADEARARERAAFEVHIAGRFRSLITDPQTWTDPAAGSFGPRRALAERVVADHPTVAADELATATAALGPFLRAQRDALNHSERDWIRPAFLAFIFPLTFTALFGIVSAFVLRGGLLLRALDIAVVTGDGKPASRLRALWRGLAAWGLVSAAFWLGVERDDAVTAAVSVCVLFLGGVVWAVVHPTRGLQDRIAGTWLVPR